MLTSSQCQVRRPARHYGKHRWIQGILGAALAVSCASAPGPRVETPRITRRQLETELTEGMTRAQVEDRVGPLLLREVMGEAHVYVEPQTRCRYIFVRDYLRDWSC